jgi:hypothetical protein
MADVFPKWIVEKTPEGLEFKLRMATYHKQLADKTENVLGGGQFYYDHKHNRIILYGKSEDFGWASKESIIEGLKLFFGWRESYARHYYYYSSRSMYDENTLEDALKNPIYTPET